MRDRADDVGKRGVDFLKLRKTISSEGSGMNRKYNQIKKSIRQVVNVAVEPQDAGSSDRTFGLRSQNSNGTHY